MSKRPESILSAMGDLVFDGDDGYEELLEDWLERVRLRAQSNAAPDQMRSRQGNSNLPAVPG